MRELLDHRSEIIRQVEEEYEHHDRITKKIKKSILQRIKLDQKIKELKISKNDADRIANEQKAYWQKEIAQMDILRQQRRRVEDFHGTTRTPFRPASALPARGHC